MLSTAARTTSREIDRLHVEAHLAALDPGDVQQILDELCLGLGGAADCVDALIGFALERSAGQQRVAPEQDRVERIAQLMGDDGEKIRLRLICFLGAPERVGKCIARSSDFSPRRPRSARPPKSTRREGCPTAATPILKIAPCVSDHSATLFGRPKPRRTRPGLCFRSRPRARQARVSQHRRRLSPRRWRLRATDSRGRSELSAAVPGRDCRRRDEASCLMISWLLFQCSWSGPRSVWIREKSGNPGAHSAPIRNSAFAVSASSITRSVCSTQSVSYI